MWCLGLHCGIVTFGTWKKLAVCCLLVLPGNYAGNLSGAFG